MPIETLFTALNSFWIHQFWCLLVLLPFFVSPLPHQQTISFLGLFSSGVGGRSCLGWDWVNREGGALRPCTGVKNSWTLSSVWAFALVNHPLWNGQMRWKSLQEIVSFISSWPLLNSLEPNTASHNNASWYTDANGVFLEHSLSGGSLYYKGSTCQKIIPGFLGSPLIYELALKRVAIETHQKFQNTYHIK